MPAPSGVRLAQWTGVQPLSPPASFRPCPTERVCHHLSNSPSTLWWGVYFNFNIRFFRQTESQLLWGPAVCPRLPLTIISWAWGRQNMPAPSGVRLAQWTGVQPLSPPASFRPCPTESVPPPSLKRRGPPRGVQSPLAWQSGWLDLIAWHRAAPYPCLQEHALGRANHT